MWRKIRGALGLPKINRALTIQFLWLSSLWVERLTQQNNQTEEGLSVVMVMKSFALQHCYDAVAAAVVAGGIWTAATVAVCDGVYLSRLVVFLYSGIGMLWA